MTLEDGTCEHVTHEKTLFFAKEGNKILGTASLRILTGILAWGALGLLLGIVIWSILYWTGLIEIDWKYWYIFRWGLLLLYLIIGTGFLGYAGLWRGLGRTILYVGIERGLVIFLVEKIFDRFLTLLHQSNKISKAIDGSQHFVEIYLCKFGRISSSKLLITTLLKAIKMWKGRSQTLDSEFQGEFAGFFAEKLSTIF